MNARMRLGLAFGLLVGLCLAQIAWWIVFQIGETGRLEHAGAALAHGDVPGALAVFEVGSGGELIAEAQRRRTMFTWEGATLGTAITLGVVFFYIALLRERRVRLDQHRFLTGATHELKTPLTTVRLGLESLRLDTLPAERRLGYVDGMLREVDRLERGLTNILAAAGLESTRDRPRLPGDLAEDLRRALEGFRERFRAADLTVQFDDPASCPIDRDEVAMRLVLHNLLDNAVKYTGQGGRIDIALTRISDTARLTVTDTGCGIPRDQLARIFERFHRAGPEHIGGTGLGLALVKEIVEAHGGAVHAESHGPCTGSRFTVDLPLREETAA